MADLSLDDELLMLAAGGEPSEEGEAISQRDDDSIRSQSRSRSLSRSPSHSPANSRTPSRSPPPQSPPDNQQTAQPQTSDRKMPRSRAIDRRKRDESEEEGEASSGAGSPHSLGSDAMDESDSDDASDAGDSTKPHMPGETAFEREKRLAEQAEHEEERLKTAKLKALFNERMRPDSKSSKRKAADIDEDDYDRRAARQRIKKDDSVATGHRGATARKERKYRELSHSPLHDGDGQAKRDDGKQPGTLQEYERVRVGRTSFPQVCFFPGFEDTFVGACARVCHGQDPVTGQNIYRMCQIKGFKTGKPYKLQASPDRAYMTDQYIIASYGSLDKEYPFAACSDSKFTEDEYHRRNQMLESQNMKPSTSAFLYQKCSAINEFLGKNWTSAQITQKVENQQRLAHLLTGVATASVGPRTLQRDYALQRRNEQNRRLNEEQVRSALLADRKRRQMLQHEAARKRKTEEERKKTAELDGLFGDDAAKEEEPPKPKPISRYVPRDYTGKKALSEFSRMRTDDEIIASMDFGIDIEI